MHRNYGIRDPGHFLGGPRCLVSDKIPYNYMSGTSMAAPVVTGSIALLCNYYGVDKMANGPEKTEKMKEIRARIAGGIHRTTEMEDKCASGGYLDLEKAVTNPYPVLDTLSQDGSSASISGCFFEDAQGALLMDGSPLMTTGWSDRQVTFNLPEGTTEGIHSFQITAASGQSQYGKDRFYLDGVRGSNEGDAAAYFEKLPAPDYEQLGIRTAVEELPAYSMASYEGKLYVTNGAIYTEKDKENYRVLLVYDEAANYWSALPTPFPAAEDPAFVQLTVHDGKICLFDTGDGFDIFSYDLNNGQTDILLQNGVEEIIDYFRIVTVKDDIWIIGGSTYNPGSDVWTPREKLLRYSTAANSLEELTIELKYPRNGACVELLGDDIFVIGGANANAQWESRTEVIHTKEMSVSEIKSANYPEVYNNQHNLAASGSFDNKLIVSGMFADQEHTSDTCIYDVQNSSWTAIPQKLLDSKLYYADGIVNGVYFYVYGLSYQDSNVENMFLRLKVLDDAAADTPSQKPDSNALNINNTKDMLIKTAAKTGDDSNPVIMLSLMVISVVIITVTGIRLVHRRNKLQG